MSFGLIYSASWDTTTKTLSFFDKAGNMIYTCVISRELPPITDDATKPLYLRSTQDGSTVWLEGNTTYVDDSTFETSPDLTTWTGLALGSSHAITLNRGDGIYIRAIQTRTGFPTSSFSQVPVCIMMTGTIEAYHNVNSMLSPNFSGISDLTTIGNNTLQGLFSPNTTNDTSTARNTALVKAPLLPATTLAPYCYNSMFLFCSNLTTPPALPATNLAQYCYNNLFNQCGLTTAPALPATTLAQYCYQRMFKNCGFAKAPHLPAPTLVSNCYRYIFEGCANLNEIHIEATSISAYNCLQNWVKDAGTGTGDFYCIGGVAYLTDSTSGIPQGWTRHDLT